MSNTVKAIRSIMSELPQEWEKAATIHDLRQKLQKVSESLTLPIVEYDGPPIELPEFCKDGGHDLESPLHEATVLDSLRFVPALVDYVILGTVDFVESITTIGLYQWHILVRSKSLNAPQCLVVKFWVVPVQVEDNE